MILVTDRSGDQSTTLLLLCTTALPDCGEPPDSYDTIIDALLQLHPKCFTLYECDVAYVFAETIGHGDKRRERSTWILSGKVRDVLCA